MSTEAQKGKHSYRLFSIYKDSSQNVKNLENLPFYTVEVGKNINISFKDQILFTINESTEKLKVSWYGNLIEFFFQLKGMKIRVLCFDDIIRISSFLPLDSFIEVSDYVRASNGTFYYNNDNKALFFSFSSGLDQDKLLTISMKLKKKRNLGLKKHRLSLIPSLITIYGIMYGFSIDSSVCKSFGLNRIVHISKILNPRYVI